MPKGVHPNHARGSRHYRWRAGGTAASNGYVRIRVGRKHPFADPNGYAYEHHIVWASAGNPRPPKGWLLHHVNGDKSDNRLENLRLVRRGEHNAEHLRADPRRCAQTGRLLPAGRTLDGVTHDARPALVHREKVT